MRVATALLTFLIVTASVLAQSGGGTSPVGVPGPHSSGGRGCPACHSPHNSDESNLPVVDAEFLSGETPESAHQPNANLMPSRWLKPEDQKKYEESIPGYTQQDDEFRGVTICLSCHDGNIAKETMLRAVPYVERAGLWPGGYGSPRRFITWQGDEGWNDDDLLSIDHPVGPGANFALVNPLVKEFMLLDPATGRRHISFPANSPEANFALNYGFPSLTSGKLSYPQSLVSEVDPSKMFVLCTTCHNPHGNPSGHISYFYLNAPYNPNAKFDPKTQAPSTSQFCRQCHFNLSNEFNGLSGIKTVY